MKKLYKRPQHETPTMSAQPETSELRTPPRTNMNDKEYRKKLAKRVADSMKAKRAANKKKCAQKRFMTSFSDPKTKYVVTEHSCTCPHFRFRCKKAGLYCKHIEQMRADMQIPEWSSKDSDWLKQATSSHTTNNSHA